MSKEREEFARKVADDVVKRDAEAIARERARLRAKIKAKVEEARGKAWSAASTSLSVLVVYALAYYIPRWYDGVDPLDVVLVMCGGHAANAIFEVIKYHLVRRERW